MKVIGPYVISAVPHLYREVMKGNPGGRQGGVQTGPPESAPAARQPGRRRSDQNARNQTTRAEGRGGGSPDASANLVLSALNALPLHGIDRLTGMPVLLHRLNEFVVPITLPDSPHLLPVTEVDIWDAHPYAVTELPPAALLATHPATAALGVLRALTALHAAGQVHGGLNAGQFWQVGREVRLAGAGLPWQPGAGPDADMHALGQARDTLGARPAVLLRLEQMTAEQALSALEAAMLPLEPVSAARAVAQPERDDILPLTLPQPELTRADLGWNGLSGAETTPLMPPGSDGIEDASVANGAVANDGAPDEGAPAAGTTWNRRKTDRGAQATVSQAITAQTITVQATTGQAVLESRPEEAVVVEVSAAQTVIAPISAPLPAPAPYRSAEDVIVIADAPQASQVEASQGQGQVSRAVGSDGAAGDVPEGLEVIAGRASEAGAGSDASCEPPGTSASEVRRLPAPIRIGFTGDLKRDGLERDGPETDLPDGLPGPLPDWTPERSEPAAVDLQTKRATSFAPASAPVQSAGEVGGAAESGHPALNPAAWHGQANPVPTSSAATRMQPLRIGWEEDHSWRVVKSGPERRGALTRRFPVWLLALVLLVLLAGAAFWLLGRAGSPAVACCSVNFTVSGSSRPVQVRLVKAPPGSTLQPGALIGTAPGELKFPNTPGQYTLEFSAQDHGALTAAVTVPPSQPFAIVLK